MPVIRYMVGSPTRCLLFPHWSETISSAEVNRTVDDFWGDDSFQRDHRLYVECDGEVILLIDIDQLWQRCFKKRRSKQMGNGWPRKSVTWPANNSMEAVIHRHIRMQIYQEMKRRSC
jgi:hypothetical protein